MRGYVMKLLPSNTFQLELPRRMPVSQLSWRIRVPLFVVAFLAGIGVGVAIRAGQDEATVGYATVAARPDRYVETGRDLDIALSHDPFVFFRMETPDGLEYFTRRGRFVLDSQGGVVSPDGAVLQPPVIVSPDLSDYSLHVAVDGLVTLYDRETDEVVVIANILLARFENPAGLEPLGDGCYRETDVSGEAEDVIPSQSGNGPLIQCFVDRYEEEGHS